MEVYVVEVYVRMMQVEVTHLSQSQVSARVMKNWDPLALGPAFAIDNSPGSTPVRPSAL